MELLIGLLFIAAIGALASLGNQKPPEKKPDEVIEIRRFGGKPLDSKSVKIGD